MFVSNGEIGAAIRRRRQELLLSQEALAGLMNVSHQQIQRYENGTDRLNVEKLQMLAHVLAVHICYFFHPENGPENSCESGCSELLTNFKKIRKDEIKALVIDFTKTCALRVDRAAES
jgi:transcriptional regulator with XRE-family HTH domain